MDLFQKSNIENYLNAKPDSMHFAQLAEVLLNENEPEAAVEICKNGLKLLPKSSEGYFVYSLALFQLNKYIEGLEQLKLCIKSDPGYLQAYYLLVKNGKKELPSEELITYYKKIQRLNPFDLSVSGEISKLSEKIEAKYKAEALQREENARREAEKQKKIQQEEENRVIEKKDVQLNEQEEKSKNPETEKNIFVKKITPAEIPESVAHLGPAMETPAEPEIPKSEKVVVKQKSSIGIKMADDDDESEIIEQAKISPKVESKKETKVQKKENKKAKSGRAIDKENEKVELNIPIPTLTFVEVLKKQKLFDQALRILEILEEKSADKSRIEKARAEIIQLKAQEAL